MISIKLIDMYIDHDSIVQVCFLKRSRIASATRYYKLRFPPFLARWRVSQDYILVLVFAAMCSEMVMRPILCDSEGKKAKVSRCRFNLEQNKIEYSCHGRYKGIHIGF